MTTTSKIPSIPMYPGGLEIGEEEKKEVLEVLDAKYLFRYYGPEDTPSKVRQLEVEFAEKVGARYALATNACTSALITSLVASGVGPGDEVIVPGYTFFASAAAVVGARAVPVIAEIDESLTLDPADVESKVTKHTKAVLPVHMRGMPCRMEALMEIARRHDLLVIEDVAQATGGTYKGRHLGTFGRCGCFSFQYHKIITAGEGGMLVTDDEWTYDRCMGYHDTAACWRPNRYALPRFEGENFCGMNFRMGELAGAVMLAQMRKLDSLLARMRRNKALIKQELVSLENVSFRDVVDEEGDTAICLVWFMDEPGRAAAVTDTLKQAGVDAKHLYTPERRDWHVYAYWSHLLNKVTPTPEGCPWRCPFYEGTVEYSPDMNPRTLEILGKAVHINVPPQLSEEDCRSIAAQIRKAVER